MLALALLRLMLSSVTVIQDSTAILSDRGGFGSSAETNNTVNDQIARRLDPCNLLVIMGCGESKADLRLLEQYQLQLKNPKVVAAMNVLASTGWAYTAIDISSNIGAHAIDSMIS